MLKEIGESKFSLDNPNTPLSSLSAFEQSFSADDWREVMRLFLVRRTRSFIIQNYAERDERDGRYYLTLSSGVRAYFPARRPHTVAFDSNSEDKNDPCARLFRQEIVDIIDGLALPRYGLSTYLKPTLPGDLTTAETKLIDDLSRAGRRLKGFCRINLFKRLESSAHAFLLSLHRHILRNELFIHALENSTSLPIGQQDATLLDSRVRDEGDGELDLADEEQELPPLHQWDESHYRQEAARIYEMLRQTQSRRYRWLRIEVFKKTLIADLRRDARGLHEILSATGEIAF